MGPPALLRAVALGMGKCLGLGPFILGSKGSGQHPRLSTQTQGHFHSGVRMKLSCRMPMDLIYVLGKMKVLKIQAIPSQSACSLKSVTSQYQLD